MRTSLGSLLTGLLMIVAIGLLTSAGWPGFVMGSVFSLSLWMMLFFGSYATSKKGFVPSRAYMTAAAIAVPFGYILFRISGDNAVMWAPALIFVGAIFPATTLTRARTR